MTKYAIEPHAVSHQESCSIPCNLCGSTEVSVLAERSRTGEPLRTVICSRCGLVWADPLPHNPVDFYENDYRVSYKGSYAPKLKHILRAGNVALSRYRKIEHFLSEPLKILDVGSGGGEFAFLLKTIGHHVKGIEPNKGYAEHSIREYGLDVEVGFIQDVELPRESFDLITLWHVLEHTQDPCDVLSRLHTLLKPHGILVIEVPNVEAKCQSPSSTFHEAHIFNFNTATLQRLAEKAGFNEMATSISADGGTITVITEKKPNYTMGTYEFCIPGNSEQVFSTVRDHTAFKHYLTAHPYARLLRRIRQTLQEKCGISSFSDGKQLLKELYSPISKARLSTTPYRKVFDLIAYVPSGWASGVLFMQSLSLS